MAEEAANVFAAQSVIEDRAADGFLQDAQQDKLLINLQRNRTHEQDGGGGDDEGDGECSPG